MSKVPNSPRYDQQPSAHGAQARSQLLVQGSTRYRPPFEGEPVGCSAKKMWLTALSKDANVEEQDCEYSFSESREPGYTSSKNRRLVNYYGSEKEARTVPGRDMAETMGSLPTSVNERLKLLASGIGKRLN